MIRDSSISKGSNPEITKGFPYFFAKGSYIPHPVITLTCPGAIRPSILTPPEKIPSRADGVLT